MFAYREACCLTSRAAYKMWNDETRSINSEFGIVNMMKYSIEHFVYEP